MDKIAELEFEIWEICNTIATGYADHDQVVEMLSKLLEKQEQLIQAVKDEEFKKHKAALRYYKKECMACHCEDCPAKGTRYCP